MARPRKPKDAPAAVKDDRRIQLKPYTFGRLMKMADKEDATPTELGNIAVKEFLKKHGYWEDAPAEADGAE